MPHGVKWPPHVTPQGELAQGGNLPPHYFISFVHKRKWHKLVFSKKLGDYIIFYKNVNEFIENDNCRFVLRSVITLSSVNLENTGTRWHLREISKIILFSKAFLKECKKSRDQVVGLDDPLF